MTQKNAIEVPAHLSPHSREFWVTVRTDFQISDETGLRLLTLAAECLDQGAILAGRFGDPSDLLTAAIEHFGDRLPSYSFAREHLCEVKK